MSSNSRKRRRESQTKQQKRMKMSLNSNGIKSSNHDSNYSNGHTNNNNNYHNENDNNNNSHNNNTNNNGIICGLSESEIKSFISSKCSIFSSYIYHTNCHSLYNILLLSHNLEFENIKCSNSNCNLINDGTFYICLHCIYYCCSLFATGSHLLYHSKTQKHYLYFELSSQQIYCILCGNYHSSSWTDQLIISFIKLSKKRLLYINNNYNIEYKEIEIKSIENIWKSFDCIHDNGMLGIRGTWNLGNTCYMTVLLQTFMHNKLLRNYYLSSYHSYKCKHKQNNNNNNNNDNGNINYDNINYDLCNCNNI
eukprot:489288_1